MSKKAFVVLGSYEELFDIQQIRAFDDELHIITPDGTTVSVSKQNVVIIDKPEKEPDGSEGVWIINPDGYYPYCSKCGYEPEIPHIHKDNRTPYCANCGAKMRKECQDDR